jgi:hypothetical protein
MATGVGAIAGGGSGVLLLHPEWIVMATTIKDENPAT